MQLVPPLRGDRGYSVAGETLSVHGRIRISGA